MSFLIDTDICSAYLKGNPNVWNRFMQYSGGLHLSAITLAELFTWVMRSKTSPARLKSLKDLLADVRLLEVTAEVSEMYGQLQARLLDSGRPAPEMDLMIAATALVHDLTLITHNTQDFLGIPGLQVMDWLAP